MSVLIAQHAVGNLETINCMFSHQVFQQTHNYVVHAFVACSGCKRSLSVYLSRTLNKYRFGRNGHNGVVSAHTPMDTRHAVSIATLAPIMPTIICVSPSHRQEAFPQHFRSKRSFMSWFMRIYQSDSRLQPECMHSAINHQKFAAKPIRIALMLS